MADKMQTIKRRMKSVSSTERITNAMKLVSAAKLKQATNRYNFVHKDLGVITEQLYEVLTKMEQVPTTYRENRSGRTLYIVFTGSKGLCGSYNSSVIKKIEEMNENVCFLPLGTKGRDFCEREGIDVFKLENTEAMAGTNELVENTPIDSLTYAQIKEVSRQVLNKYKNDEWAEIVLMYTGYVNSIVHEVRVKRVFPIQSNENFVGNCELIEYDTKIPNFFDNVAEEYLALKIYGAIVESTLCEHSARRMAMKNASDNAKAMLAELSVYYNRARQAAITNEIIEIIAGAEVQK